MKLGRSGTLRRGTVKNSAPFAPLAKRDFWPTPVSGGSRTGGVRAFDGGARSRALLRERVGDAANEMQRIPNPAWVEWLMGFTLTWTDTECASEVYSPESAGSISPPAG